MPAVPPSVCLLDDEPSVVKALGRLLASEGIACEQFSEATQFLSYAQTHAVQVAVLDIRMPGMSGFIVQQALGVLHPRATVIMITAEDEPSNRAAAMAGGAVAFILKPIDSEVFIAAVRRALAA